MHHFVVKFSQFLRLSRQGGIDPLNQNPADVPGCKRDTARMQLLLRRRLLLRARRLLRATRSTVARLYPS